MTFMTMSELREKEKRDTEGKAAVKERGEKSMWERGNRKCERQLQMGGKDKSFTRAEKEEAIKKTQGKV